MKKNDLGLSIVKAKHEPSDERFIVQPEQQKEKLTHLDILKSKHGIPTQ